MFDDQTLVTEEELHLFGELAYSHAGIRIKETKINLVSNRLRRRLKETGHHTFRDYYQFLTGNSPRAKAEFPEFINAITTNETYFFRAPRHWWTLSKMVLPEIEAMKSKQRPKTIDVWCAAASTGEEPYTIAILLRERLTDFKSWTINFWASDINDLVLKRCKEARYNEYALRYVRPEILKRYFRDNGDGSQTLSDEIRRMVRFGRHNLMDPFPKGQVDLLFVRNVLIYFDEESKEVVNRNILNATRPGGYVFYGESEMPPKIPEFRVIVPTVVRRA